MRPFFRTTRDNEKGSTMRATILLVDDDAEIRELLELLLTGEGYAVLQADSGEAALDLLGRGASVDLIILDVMMPGLSGYKTCARVRETSNVPILFLTARGMDTDLTLGFSAGGDDYLVKPFALDEVMARVRALSRRGRSEGSAVLTLGDLSMDTSAQKVTRAGKPIPLTGREYALLEYLMRNQGAVLSRERIEQNIFNYDYEGASNMVDVYIRYLRRKIDEGFSTKLIHTVRGAGYVLREEA